MKRKAIIITVIFIAAIAFHVGFYGISFLWSYIPIVLGPVVEEASMAKELLLFVRLR
jgi:hypothetical protein